ncbi:hypothetical protein WJX82_004815 [Trebouxia sp. C0006]
MKTYAFRLQPHQDLMAEIVAFGKANNIRAGVLLTCVGSLEQVTLRGEHIHLSVSDGQGRTTGGHMLPGNKVYTTAEIVVGALGNVEFEREMDPTYGYAELAVHTKTPNQ